MKLTHASLIIKFITLNYLDIQYMIDPLLLDSPITFDLVKIRARLASQSGGKKVGCFIVYEIPKPELVGISVVFALFAKSEEPSLVRFDIVLVILNFEILNMLKDFMDEIFNTTYNNEIFIKMTQ